MQKTWKRILALLLALMLCLSALPFSGFAVEDPPDDTAFTEAMPSEAPAESSAGPEDNAGTSTEPSPAPSTEPTSEPTTDSIPKPTTGPADSGLTPGAELDMNRVWPAIRCAQARTAGTFRSDGTR